MEYEHLKSLTHHQLITPWTLKTVTKFLVPVSVFSLIYYSKYSSWCCLLLHSLKFYLSAIPLHALDKRWIFLICNGILVVVASTSAGLVQSKIDDDQRAPPEEIKEESLPPVEGEVLPVLEAAEDTGNAEGEIEEEEEEKEEEGEEKAEEEGGQVDEYFEEEQGGNSCLIEEDRHDEGHDDDHHEVDAEETITYILEDGNATRFFLEEESLMQAEEEEEEEEVEEEAHGMEKLSAEELNKKFDDFIRKMKEELRIEAQQQLVVVK